ncbi:hypothetical protein BZA77DRAFT_288868 [Pyronema omphalodes]|nr:hypothetical protein BZA77DRAFT_288868 [Pyronema omphalodes]
MTIFRHREDHIGMGDHAVDNPELVDRQQPVFHDWYNSPIPDSEPRPSLALPRTLETEDIQRPVVDTPDPAGANTNEEPNPGNEQPKEPSIIDQMDIVDPNDPVRPGKHPRFRRICEWIKEKANRCPKFKDILWIIRRAIGNLIDSIKAFFQRIYNRVVDMFWSKVLRMGLYQ